MRMTLVTGGIEFVCTNCRTSSTETVPRSGANWPCLRTLCPVGNR
jgi:hypothetical protein